MTQFKEYRVTANAFDVEYVKARNETEAITKAKAKMDLKPRFTVEPANLVCSGTYRKGCTNTYPINDKNYQGWCRECRYDAEEGRINSPA